MRVLSLTDCAFIADAIEFYNEHHGPEPNAPLDILINRDGTTVYTGALAELFRDAIKAEVDNS